MNVRISKEQKVKIANSQDVFNIMCAVLKRQSKFRRKQEYFWTIGLSTAHDIEYIELVALGRLNAVNVEPVELYSIAVQKRCKRILLVHNHPAGSLKPSKADLTVTQFLKTAAKLLKIELIDHLIISETGFFSFVDEGLML